MNQLRNFAGDPAVFSEVLQRINEGRQPNEPMTDPADPQAALLTFDPCGNNSRQRSRKPSFEAWSSR